MHSREKQIASKIKPSTVKSQMCTLIAILTKQFRFKSIHSLLWEMKLDFTSKNSLSSCNFEEFEMALLLLIVFISLPCHAYSDIHVFVKHENQ